jgi:hypothetical protein
VRALAAEFVPAADAVRRLQRGCDPECRLFRTIAEQGHRAGLTEPTDTRQGIYAATPSGLLLGSNNATTPGRVAEMLRRALHRWASLSREERLLPGLPPPAASVDRYPTDGLVLQVAVRDLPRSGTSGSGSGGWNRDFAWFTRAEAASFVPRDGEEDHVPAHLVRRLARFHLLDFVGGQTPSFPDAALETAELATRVTERGRPSVSLRFEGRTRAAERGRWPVNGFHDQREPGERQRGYDAKLAGCATWDRVRERFTAFALVAVGTRWGGSQFNRRTDDLGAAPMGVAFTPADDAQRIAPAFLRRYGW